MWSQWSPGSASSWARAPDRTPPWPMQHTLESFLRALRAHDIRVSPAEAIDAHRAAAEVGYGDRALLKDALCVTLAKTADEVDRFDACFETFFARPAAKPTTASSTGSPSASLPPDAPSLASQLMAADQAG